MKRTDTTKKPAERFSILIVPRNRSRIRRIDASSRSLKLAVGGFAALVGILALSVFGLLSYRDAYNDTQSMRLEAAKFVAERAELLSRVAALEGAISRTERFAAKIEAQTGKGAQGRVGQGPVEEQDLIPSAPSSTPISLGRGMWESPFSKSLTEGLTLKLDKLMDRNDLVEGKLHAAFSLQQDKLHFWASLPTVWPAKGWITSEFGARRGWGRMHDGIDIAGPIGTPVTAPGDGIVTYSGYRHGYGKMMVIDHGYGISTVYAHCSSVYADEGLRVKRGSLVASIGNTGSSTGPHLHFEVHVDGAPVDPLLYLAGRM